MLESKDTRDSGLDAAERIGVRADAGVAGRLMVDCTVDLVRGVSTTSREGTRLSLEDMRSETLTGVTDRMRCGKSDGLGASSLTTLSVMPYVDSTTAERGPVG